MSSLPRRFAIIVLAAASLAGASGAHAQGVQVLDSVDGYATGSVLNMGFRDPLPRIDFQKLEVGVHSVVACQRAITQGLYCIDGSILRFWPNTGNVVAGVIPDIDVLNCTDPVLGFDHWKPNPCTSVTVDYNGAIWLAGRKSNSHSLVKVVAKSKLGTACGPGGPWRELAALAQDAPHPPQATGAYCAREYAPGRPSLVDINPVDGELAAAFPLGAGIVGLEERKTAVFFPDVDNNSLPLPPVVIASGKTPWGLIGNEQLLSAAVLQYGPAGGKQNYVLATTTLGRVLAKPVGSTGKAFRVFDIPANRTDPAIDYSRCNGDTHQYYGIRVSSQSERVYVSDRACGQVIALNWRTSTDAGYPAGCDAGTTGSFCLVNARESESLSSPEQDVTIATVSSDPAVTVSPDGVSIAPGIGIDLADCGIGETCTLVADGTDPNAYPGAVLTGVVIEGPKSLMTVFQVKGIPDCRHWPAGPGCAPGLIVPGPRGDYLDVAPLLPIEVTSQFPNGLLPQMLIAPNYRGQGSPARFDAFVGIPEPGVQFRETFTATLDVADLAGSNLGCGGSTTNRPDINVDIVTTVSEVYGSVGGPSDDPTTEHVDMLVNTDCFNPTKIAGGRWSLYAYNLRMNDVGDGVYATLVRSLFDDLLSAQQQTACVDIDDPTSSVAALSPATCAKLTSKWNSANKMLSRCIRSSTYPRQSQAVNNCNAFRSQFAQYESALAAAPRVGPDPANRLGELEVRTQVIRYMFDEHFVPSIPPNGFEDL